jgi:hypothetical protein
MKAECSENMKSLWRSLNERDASYKGAIQSYRYNTSHSKWKENMLRRSNNGVKGKILKGNSKNKYSGIINRLQSDKRNE